MRSEITLRVIGLTIILALTLAVANTYLALKIGILASASIPAAILSMGVLRFFKNTTLLEHNLVQTGASAGEAVAGGIVYTIPALIILNYWHHFSYTINFFIGLLSSFAGVFLSVPLRKYLMNDESLRFPEGRAVAEVIQLGDTHAQGFKDILLGGFWGALLEALQTSNVLNGSITVWQSIKGIVFGCSFGFSALLFGAGYLMGWDIALSMILGSILTWVIGVPLLSLYDHNAIVHLSGMAAMQQVLSMHLREIGVSAMLIAGIITLSILLKTFGYSLQFLFKKIQKSPNNNATLSSIESKERDLPLSFVVLGLIFSFLGITLLIIYFLPVHALHFAHLSRPEFLSLFVIYLLFMGFILAAIAGYFSGLVGVTASPGSAIVIAGMLISALLVKFVFSMTDDGLTLFFKETGMAFTILLGGLLTGMACIANDNMQDLKVGHILGATPWKQQLMLLLGALVASAIVPLVMELLFQTYGIAGIVPHAGMNVTETLPAPPAAIMAMLAKGVFMKGLDWPYFIIGAGFIFVLFVFKIILQKFNIKLSLLAIAIGIYLPMSTSTSLFLGGCLAWWIKRQCLTEDHPRYQHGYLIACGVVVGAILIDVCLALFQAFSHDSSLVNISFVHWNIIASFLGFFAVVFLAIWWVQRTKRSG